MDEKMSLEWVRDEMRARPYVEDSVFALWADAIDAEIKARGEPVGYVNGEASRFGNSNINIGTVIWYTKGGKLWQPNPGTQIYTAPPAQASQPVGVPDASWFAEKLCIARNEWGEKHESTWLETDENHPDEWIGSYIRDALLAAPQPPAQPIAASGSIGKPGWGDPIPYPSMGDEPIAHVGERAQPSADAEDAARWRMLLKGLRSKLHGPGHGTRIKLVEVCPMYGDEQDVGDVTRLIDAARAAEGDGNAT